MTKQTPPFAVQIELVEGCNLFCDFCGLRGIREHPGGPYCCMTTRTLKSIVTQIAEVRNWNPRIEFAMHGEPTMHPEMVDLIWETRQHLPWAYIMMTSNGGGLTQETTQRINELFRAGLNVLALDDYKRYRIVEKVKERYKGPYRILHYPLWESANPHHRRKPQEHNIVIVEDISIAEKGTHSQLCNHAGAAAPRNQSAQGKRCAKPFRELSIRWDGMIALCCNDWRGEYFIGHVNSGIIELWDNKRFQIARKKLYHGQRDFGPCDGCDAISHRVGLLPDQYGKEDLPELTYEEGLMLSDIVEEEPLTTPVLRPWEIA